MKKVAIAIVLIAVLSGRSELEETQLTTATPTVDVPSVQTPTAVVEVVESESHVESEPIINEPVFALNDYERWVVECMVMGESGNEPYDGQVLVAQCILNACLKDGILPSQVRVQYKYSGWNETPTESVKQAVSNVFDDGYQITNEPILYFYAPKYSEGRFHNTQKFIMEVGGHRFFAEWEDWN